MAETALGKPLATVLLFTALVTLLVMGIGLILSQIFEPKPGRKDAPRR